MHSFDGESDMKAARLRGGLGLLLMGVLFAGAGPAHGQEADRSASVAAPSAQPTLPRLTQRARNKQYLKALVGPQWFVVSALSAGEGQLRDRPREWHQGASGFGRRFASSLAEHATQETLKFGLASLLHEDNRWVPSGRTRFRPRLLYALESTFRSRDENGIRQVSYSKIGSLAGASLISRTWQPASTGGVGNGAVNFGVDVVFAASINVAREFLHR
jgi:hypothetical protein